MDDIARAELDTLRRRAYGPGPGLADDPPARARLAELEGRSLPGAPPSADTSSSSEEGPEGSREGPKGGEEGSSVSAAAPDRHVGRRWWRTRPALVVLWCTSVLLAAGGAAAVTAAITPPPPPLVAGTQHIATLAVDEDYSFWGQTGYDEFLGLVPSVDSYSGTDCMTVYVADLIVPGSDSYQGVSFSGCGAGAFPAATVIPVSAVPSAALQRRYSDMTTLQFVLTDEGVQIYSDAA